MTKEEVVAKIKAILNNDPRFRGGAIKVKFIDKKKRYNEKKYTQNPHENYYK